jgi:hypothetical protein
MLWVDAHITYALIQEVYTRHLAALSLINQDSKITVSRAQALAIWSMCQEYQPVLNPEMGNLLMHLHQKLS